MKKIILWLCTYYRQWFLINTCLNFEYSNTMDCKARQHLNRSFILKDLQLSSLFYLLISWMSDSIITISISNLSTEGTGVFKYWIYYYIIINHEKNFQTVQRCCRCAGSSTRNAASHQVAPPSARIITRGNIPDRWHTWWIKILKLNIAILFFKMANASHLIKITKL